MFEDNAYGLLDNDKIALGKASFRWMEKQVFSVGETIRPFLSLSSPSSVAKFDR